MNISAVEANNAVNLLSLSGCNKTEQTKISESKEICDVFTESDETSKFKEIVGKYDITNISSNEAHAMYKELYDNKLISLKDMLVTLDISRIPGWKDGVSSISGWKKSSNPDEKQNLLQGLKIQADYNKNHGNPSMQNAYDSRLELAEKILHFQS
jgi:hypothetical protein